MRALLLIAGAALALGSCGKNNQSDEVQNADASLTAANIVSNDVTAIDAVTGDAANMAADVDMNFGGLDQNGAAPSLNGVAVKPSRPAAAKPSRPATAKPSTASPANSMANAAANSQ